MKRKIFLSKRPLFIYPLILLIMLACTIMYAGPGDKELAAKIKNNKEFDLVYKKGLSILGTGFSAGSGYAETWIRDLNTFIVYALKVRPRDEVKEALLNFFRFQGFDGNMIDGYMKIPEGHMINHYYRSIRPDMPGYAFHKNTVETDQETSLVQAVWRYIEATGDREVLLEEINGITILERMELMLSWLMNHRFSTKYGMIWGATTADWGDVQPNHPWGIQYDESTLPAVDIYDNAMFLIALDGYFKMQEDPVKLDRWKQVYREVRKNIKKQLWDEEEQKFIPHLYFNCEEFPGVDERRIYYHGGTAVAIQAGLMEPEEILASLEKMRENVRASGAASIGLTMYPPYPEGVFQNEIMKPYHYQNGGDWTWFGARMITALVKHGFPEQAYVEIQPFIKRAIENDGFYEWYSMEGEPRGSGVFRGSAGVLLEAIDALREWAGQLE